MIALFLNRSAMWCLLIAHRLVFSQHWPAVCFDMLNTRRRLVEHCPQLNRDGIAGGKGAMASRLLDRCHQPLARDTREWLDRHHVDPAIPRMPTRRMHFLPE